MSTTPEKMDKRSKCCLATRCELLVNHCPNSEHRLINSQDMVCNCHQKCEKSCMVGFPTQILPVIMETSRTVNHPTGDYCGRSDLLERLIPKQQTTCRCPRLATSSDIEGMCCLPGSEFISNECQNYMQCRNCEDRNLSLKCCHSDRESVTIASPRARTQSCHGNIPGASLTTQLQANNDSLLDSLVGVIITYTSLLLRLCISNVVSMRRCQNPLSLCFLSKPSHTTSILSTWCLPMIIAILLCTSSVDAQSWSHPPEDSSAIKGASVTLQCGIRDLGDRSIQWIQYLGEETKLLFLDGEQFSDDVPARYSVSGHTAGGPGVSGYDLTLAGVREEDDRLYECAVQRLGEVQAQLTVLVPPGSPLIQVDNISDLTAGDLATLTCTTSGGNPHPVITWYRADMEITGVEVTPPTTKFGTTQSVLTHALTKDDHQVTFRCEAENSANSGSPVETSRTLAVKYAPVLDVGPYNPLRVVETSQVTLTCDVDSYPTISAGDVEWFDGSGVSLGVGFEVTFQGVSKSHAGRYTCRAENVVDFTTHELELDVHYGPKVVIHHSRGEMSSSELSITEDTPLNLTCLVDANPSVDVDTIIWKKDNIAVHTGPYYYRNHIKRDDSGEYSCTASNTLSPSEGATEPHTGGDTVQLIVQYEPGRATLTIPSETIKNQRIELTCTVDDKGFPEAALEWTVLGSSTLLHVGSVLTFDPLELSDTNDYICTPTNVVGHGEAATRRLDVLELPEWMSSLPLTTESLINNSALSVQCEVRGQPRPQVTWFIDDQPVSASPDLFTVVEHKKSVDVYSWNVTSVLQWRGFARSPSETSLVPGDSGMYRCHVTSDIARSPLSSTTQLSVLYPPVVSSPSDKVAADARGSARLECRAHSLPAATFVWYNGTERVQSGGRVQISDVDVGGEFPFETSLTISNIQPYDFSTYTCQAANSLGLTERPISLTVKTVPDPPSSLRVHSKTWESVEISWQPGFDGGYTQSFVVSYSSPTQKAGQLTIEGASRLNVTMLYPSANYSFQVQGQNQLGSGERSAEVATETEFFIIDPPTAIEYNPNTFSVTFDSPSTYYCARVDINDGNRWTNYVQCALTEGGSVQVAEGETVDNLRVALCLQARQDVCSEPEEAVFLEAEDDLPTYVVIVIGVVCAVIVIVLTLVLVYLCIRHNRSSKEEDDKEASNQGQPIKPLGNGHAKLNSSIDSPTLDNGHHLNNPGYQGDDRSHGNRSPPVFTTDTSQGAFFPDDYYKQRVPTGVPNGGAPQYHYDNQTNLQREHSFKMTGARDGVDGGPYGQHHKPRIAPEKQYLYEDNHNTTKDSHNSGEGSVSSDSKQPKKVMYEVVV